MLLSPDSSQPLFHPVGFACNIKVFVGEDDVGLAAVGRRLGLPHVVDQRPVSEVLTAGRYAENEVCASSPSPDGLQLPGFTLFGKLFAMMFSLLYPRFLFRMIPASNAGVKNQQDHTPGTQIVPNLYPSFLCPGCSSMLGLKEVK